jgi:hypothetical protein
MFALPHTRASANRAPKRPFWRSTNSRALLAESHFADGKRLMVMHGAATHRADCAGPSADCTQYSPKRVSETLLAQLLQ